MHRNETERGEREDRITLAVVADKLTMKEDQEFQLDEKKEAAADVLFNYSKFVMSTIGSRARPCDLRIHLMKEISGMPTSLNREPPQTAASPDAMGESSSSGTARLDKTDSFRAL